MKRLSLFRDALRNSNLTNFFGQSPRDRELQETRTLLRLARRGFEASRWANRQALDDFIIAILSGACAASDATPGRSLALALYGFVDGLVELEGVFSPPLERDPRGFTPEQGVALRYLLSRQLRFLGDEQKLSLIWERKVWAVVSTLVEMLPASILIDERADGSVPEEAPRLEVSLIDLFEDPIDVIEGMMAAFYDQQCVEAGLFGTLRKNLERNLYRASGINPETHDPSQKQLVTPKRSKLGSTRDVIETYCANTPLRPLLLAPVPFSIPFPCRFEHTHVLGGSGHGKTQLLQYLIAHDLEKAKEDKRSIVVMDSQGDLIRTIASLSLFDPDDPEGLANRLLIVDPTDVEFPACLNMFDWNRGRIDALKPLDRERMLNGTVELYEYLFGALLGAELTQRQGVIFKYIARLMMEIPGATIQTLRELMENGEKFRPLMEKLPGSARAFFETRFFDRTFNETKKQILTRLWGVLSNSTFERMFSHERNKVDLYDAMSAGKIVLINTAKELLTHDGAAIFGRFFIALVAQASLQRSALQPHERNPAFVYIDEAQDYFDDKIGQLLNQARKYRVGMVLAHQNLDQLSLGLRSTIMSSTSIKLAGGVSAKDARALAEDMRCDDEFLQKMRKSKERTEFACFVRNFTPKAVQVSVPLGFVERMPRLSQGSVTRLIDANRLTYGAPVADVNRLLERPPAPEKPPSSGELIEREAPERCDGSSVPLDLSPPTIRTTISKPAVAPPIGLVRESRTLEPFLVPALSGKGGQRHKYIQQLVKRLGEEFGFRAVVEEPVLDRTGQVDVALYRDDLKIACEISVTTGSDQELRNVEKCLAAGFTTVFLVADAPRQLATLRKAISAEINETDAERVTFCLASDLPSALEVYRQAKPEQTVRGYRVRVNATNHGGDTSARRRVIADVIARSLAKHETR